MSDVVNVALIGEPGEVQADRPGSTRAEFFKRVAGGGVVLGGGLLVTGLPAAAHGQGDGDVTAVLNFALTLEYLEAAFYAEAVARGALAGELLEFARVVGGHEAEHVEFLRGALGSAAVASPTFDFQNTTGSAATFGATAIVLEDTGVSAYNGQGPNVPRRLLPAAASIVSVEARHAAWIRRIVNGPGYAGGAERYPAPEAFDDALTREQVLEAVAATNFIQG